MRSIEEIARDEREAEAQKAIVQVAEALQAIKAELEGIRAALRQIANSAVTMANRR